MAQLQVIRHACDCHAPASVRPAGVVKAPRRAVHVRKEVVLSKIDAAGQHIQPTLA